MAGVKGKSGGPRPNAGGARTGAGRPKKASAKSANATAKGSGEVKRSKADPIPIEDRDMLQLLQDVALGRVGASTTQVRAAIAAVQYTHTKKGDGGKKEEAAGKAKTAGQGRFKPAPTPLKLVGGK